MATFKSGRASKEVLYPPKQKSYSPRVPYNIWAKDDNGTQFVIVDYDTYTDEKMGAHGEPTPIVLPLHSYSTTGNFKDTVYVLCPDDPEKEYEGPITRDIKRGWDEINRLLPDRKNRPANGPQTKFKPSRDYALLTVLPIEPTGQEGKSYLNSLQIPLEKNGKPNPQFDQLITIINKASKMSKGKRSCRGLIVTLNKSGNLDTDYEYIDDTSTFKLYREVGETRGFEDVPFSEVEPLAWGSFYPLLSEEQYVQLVHRYGGITKGGDQLTKTTTVKKVKTVEDDLDLPSDDEDAANVFG